MSWLITTVVFLPLFETACAQDASCLPFYSWASNPQKQNPCQIASILISECNGGPFNVPPLPSNDMYVGPTLQMANPCQCNTVTYSLMSACGACQGQDYVSWSVWSGNCATVSIDIYPESIPSDTSIPGWAYLDVTANDNWDQTNARANANLTASSALPSPTSSIAVHNGTSTQMVSSSTTRESSTSIATTTSSTPSATNLSNSSDLSEKHANAVGGGVVGGLIGLVIIFGGIVWYIYHRRRMNARTGMTYLSSPVSANGSSLPGQGPYMNQVPPPAESAFHSLTGSSVGNETPYRHDSTASGSADSVPTEHAGV